MNSINIVCHNVYPIFDPTITWGIGGMETRAALLARGLALSGRWNVRVIVSDFGQPRRVRLDGIEFDVYQPYFHGSFNNVTPRFARRKWFPALNLDRRDIPLIWQIPLIFVVQMLPGWLYSFFWRRRKADVVCCFGNNVGSAQVIADCRRTGMATVLCIASDDDLSPDYRPDDESLNDYGTPKWLAHYALENADHVFVQTESQLRFLKSRFGRHGELIRNPVDISTDAPTHWPARGERDLILWIGRSDTFHKQPLLLIELAKRCPDLPFLMIMNKTHVDVFDAVQAKRPANLTIVEWVPHREIWNYYRRARVFVSTSAYEGFPNTFLQCAVAGVPVTSLAVDPEEMFSQHRCGLLAEGDLERLERDVRSLWSNTNMAEDYARTFHKYALAHHGLDSQINCLETLLQKIIGTPLHHPAPPWWRQPHQRFLRRLEN